MDSGNLHLKSHKGRGQHDIPTFERDFDPIDHQIPYIKSRPEEPLTPKRFCYCQMGNNYHILRAKSYMDGNYEFDHRNLMENLERNVG
jgi:hypothetical protein